MDVKLEHEEQAKITVVRIDGDATVRSAAELKAALMEAIAGAREVVIDLEGISGIDAAFLQLLCAAEKSAAAVGKAFRLGGACPEALAVSFAEAGFPPRHNDEKEVGVSKTQSEHGGDTL